MATFASAAGPQFLVRCEAGRQISLRRVGATSGTALTLRTTFGDRAVPASVSTASSVGLAASLSVSDSLLDQLAFSRGRFAVDAEGLPRLIVPAWPEPAKVIEDCRA